MKVSYYPGCSLGGTSKEFGDSTVEVASLLDIELVELPDWTCCGASSAHVTNDGLAVELPARDLLKADKIGLDLLVPCAACFQRLKYADKELKARKNGYRGNFKIMHVADFLWEAVGEKGLKPKIKKSLKGLNPVCYYGCLTSRPPRVTDAARPEDPQSMDRILKAAGADVKNWSFKTDCCGGSLMFTRPDIAKKMVTRLLDAAVEAGADCIAAACPVCQSNLDTRQDEISRETGKAYNIPVFYVTELLGLALGSPDVNRWLKAHLVDTRPLLKQKGLI